MENNIASTNTDFVYMHQYFSSVKDPSANVKAIIEAIEAKLLAGLKANVTPRE